MQSSPSKRFYLHFGKGKRQSELKSIPTDPLKLVLACVFNTFIGGDRVILPMMLEWKNNYPMSSSDLKEFWLSVSSGFQREMPVKKGMVLLELWKMESVQFLLCFLLMRKKAQCDHC